MPRDLVGQMAGVGQPAQEYAVHPCADLPGCLGEEDGIQMGSHCHFAVRSCETPPGSEATPIWLAALFAAPCRATNGIEGHAVIWNCLSGRAVYTNAGAHAEHIEPLGISLQQGQTLAVYWIPGETAYTMEVHGHPEIGSS